MRDSELLDPRLDLTDNNRVPHYPHAADGRVFGDRKSSPLLLVCPPDSGDISIQLMLDRWSHDLVLL